jgi:N-acetylmuramic acid 6-phosphate etherase
MVSAPTEERHPGTGALDAMTTLELLRTLNDEDARVAPAVGRVLPQLAAAVDLTVDRISSGGTVHYFGAGTSGRLAVIDAAELLPTFNAPAGLFVAHHAGGPAALLTAVENVEDDIELGARDASAVGPCDVVIGLTASGRTPYVAGALAAARGRGALTLLVTANPRAELAHEVDVLLAVDTGPEVITGSTRLKAGSAQKLVLNSFSTAVMVNLGRTWSNLMVDLVATNAKLRGRVIRILREATGADEATARAALETAGGQLKPALLSLLAEVGPDVARTALEQHSGSVAQALRSLQPPPGSAPPGAERHGSEPHGSEPHGSEPPGTDPHEQETAR